MMRRSALVDRAADSAARLRPSATRWRSARCWEWTTSLARSAWGCHRHDDAEREVAYDPPTPPVGKLDLAARFRPRSAAGTVVSMRKPTGRGCSGSGIARRTAQPCP